MAEDNSKIQGLAWFIAGLGVGALVGILYAPKSGKEIREDLATGAREGTEFLRDKTHQAVEHVGEYVERGREVAGHGRAQWEEFVERGKNLVSDQTSRVSAAVEAGRQAYRSGAEPEEPAAPQEPAV